MRWLRCIYDVVGAKDDRRYDARPVRRQSEPEDISGAGDFRVGDTPSRLQPLYYGMIRGYRIGLKQSAVLSFPSLLWLDLSIRRQAKRPKKLLDLTIAIISLFQSLNTTVPLSLKPLPESYYYHIAIALTRHGWFAGSDICPNPGLTAPLEYEHLQATHNILRSVLGS